MRLRFAALFFLVTLAASLAAADRPPISVRLAPEVKPLTPGLSASVAVVIRNDSRDQPIALRAVAWQRGAADDFAWINITSGRVADAARGAIVHDRAAPGFTELMFERGLLLPGEEIGVARRLTPQDEQPAAIVVRYALVGRGRDWRNEILLPADWRGNAQTYSPVTRESIAARKAHGGLGLARDTMKPFMTDPPAIIEWNGHVSLRFAADATYQSTGGISIIEAGTRLKIDRADRSWHGVYCPLVEAWFFVNGRSEAHALVKTPDPNPRVPPTAPPGFVPKPYKWETRPMPAMASRAADFFCVDDIEGTTEIELDPPRFGDVTPVAPPRPDGLAAPTRVPAAKLLAVLERGREKNLELRYFAGGIPPDIHRVLRFVAPAGR